jgi:hypothetical protein
MIWSSAEWTGVLAKQEGATKCFCCAKKWGKVSCRFDSNVKSSLFAWLILLSCKLFLKLSTNY